MSSLLSAELAAACSALGYYDEKSNKYYADSNTLETVKDLIRYLRRDDETHDIRRQLGEIKVVQTDLIPLLKSYWEETDLFDVLLRLMVNLTTPALMLWNEEIPTDKITRNQFLQVEDHLQSYKQAFADETFWAVLSTRLSKILEIDYAERGDENSLIIERILILVRNILYVPPDPNTEKRPDNDASIHDQVLWALHQSGMLDIILYITSSTNEKAYYMHTLEILSFMLREQRAAELARAALQRSETEKIRDEAELLAIRHRETNQRRQKVKMYNGARHSRFGGTYVLKSMKSISENELIYHKPLNKLESLNFDVDKKKPKTPKNRMPIVCSTFERRSAFSIRLFLKEFCVEFLNGAYNTLMYHVKDNLVRARAQAHDESYYLWALRFFMEFNRCYKFEVKLVSETMSVQTFRYVQQLMEKYFDMIQTDKKKVILWSRRLHLALLAYRELLLTICVMDKSPDRTVQESARVIKSNIFYILEYREFVITLLITYDELKMSNAYLKDLMETQHIFLKMLESFCGTNSSVVVQKKVAKRRKKKKASQNTETVQPEQNLESRWDEVAPQLSAILEGSTDFTSDVVPFDAASDTPIDEQKSEAMKNVQRKLRNGEFENAISLLRAAREVWPEDNCFGSNNMAPEEEFLALRDVFFADLGENDVSPVIEEQPVYDENDEEEDEDGASYGEANFKFQDFVKRLAHFKVVRACGLALADFETNSVNTNHCIIKLLHRIAFDCKLYVMVFQLSLFRTFQRIYANKDFPQYRELVKFATYIIRQFVRIAETNKKVFMECLFWKNSGEAYEIEHGYGSLQKEKKGSARSWTTEEEEELRRLFKEHEEKELEGDVVNWIVSNLIDNTRTRRGVLKKLKEMRLLADNKERRKSGVTAKIRRHWGAEEETQLRELYDQFKDAADPLDCIIARLDQPRSKRTVVQKLLDLGLIQSKAEVRKKRGKSARALQASAGPSRASDSSDSEEESEGSDDDDDDDGGDDDSGAPQRRQKRQTKKQITVNGRKKTSKAAVRRTFSVSYERTTGLLIKLVDAGMREALEWLKESFSDAVEDFEDDENSEGIPLVPIMDYAVNAMEDANFQETLRSLGITEPADEQETYWRIPGHLSVDLLKKNIEILQQAIDNKLTSNETSQNSNDHNPGTSTQEVEIVEHNEGETSSINLETNKSGRSIIRRLVDDSSGEENQEESNINTNQEENVNNSLRRIVDSSDDENKDNESHVDSEQKQRSGRRFLNDSSDEENNELNVENNKNGSMRRRKLINDSDDENENQDNQNNGDTSNRRNEHGSRYVIDDSDEYENEADSKRSRIESDSDTEKPVPKRSRVISSDEE